MYAMLQKTAMELKQEIKSESILHFLVLWSTEENHLHKGCIDSSSSLLREMDFIVIIHKTIKLCVNHTRY